MLLLFILQLQAQTKIAIKGVMQPSAGFEKAYLLKVNTKTAKSSAQWGCIILPLHLNKQPEMTDFAYLNFSMFYLG